MKILLVDRCSLECVYGGGRISITQGRDMDASTMTTSIVSAAMASSFPDWQWVWASFEAPLFPEISEENI